MNNKIFLLYLKLKPIKIICRIILYNMSEVSSQEQFNNILKKYLENITNISNEVSEFEIRFGTKGIKQISQIDFNNVIKVLKSRGFEIQNLNAYSLKMQSEYLDKKTGKDKLSNVRVQLDGIHEIQKYCNTNSISELNPTFTEKKYAISNDTPVYPVDVNAYNLRASYQTEKKIASYSAFAEKIKKDWSDSKKEFRYINRTSFIHPDIPVRVDLSIVKSNFSEEYNYKGQKRYRSKREYTIQSANVFNNVEKYEIEIEILNDQVGIGTNFNTIEKLSKIIRKTIIYVLSGLQNTNYPISYNKIRDIGIQYLKLVHNKEYNEKIKMKPRYFLGPSSSTLQIVNITPINDDSNIPNIRKNYTVTEKADGLRKLLYINNDGEIYLIDTNMNVQFTGAKTKNVDLFQTIIDGEHILHNKKGDYINLYMAFDVYIVNKKDIRANAFIPELNTSNVMNKYRLPVLVNIIKELDPISLNKDNMMSPIRIECKNFKAESEEVSIFQCCNTIIQQQKEGFYEYEIDGLIFTPSYLGVGSEKLGEAGPLTKHSWQYSLKWKPSEFNTIDFLVTTKKNSDNNSDFIGNIFENGINSKANEQLSQYKTLILRVGFDESKHGYINPCANIINHDYPSSQNNDDINNYRPMPFYPTNPTDYEANICNVMLKSDQNGNKRLFTEEGEVFSDGMIVEFRYDLTKENKWRWIPLRLRYDKTEEYKKGFPQYGNAYHVANNNWHSIHNPITEEMIRTGRNIPDEFANDNIYYNRISGNTNTRALRDFHNLFVKNLLITGVSKKGDTLIDYAVGKAGDLPKWIKSKLSFVFGIDISEDNIDNRLDGACARYLNYHNKFKVIPSALFVNGNSELNIRDGDALYNEKGKQIAKAVFGEGPKDANKLGQGVYKNYGKGKEGFNVSSCQFAIHYFFKDKITINNYLRNVSECTKLNGYFIGTCYNGSRIFEALQKVSVNDSISIFKNNNKIWQITKRYDHAIFEEDETSLGYEIDVYQESINKTFREYLVNFDYFNRLMENYGFVLLNKNECQEIGLNNSVGSFQDLFEIMKMQVNKNSKIKNELGDALDMTYEEKQISYLNNYFIYKKNRSVDTISVYNTLIGSSKLQNKLEEMDTKEAQISATEQQNLDKKKTKAPKKLNKKLKLLSNSN